MFYFFKQNFNNMENKIVLRFNQNVLTLSYTNKVNTKVL